MSLRPSIFGYFGMTKIWTLTAVVHQEERFFVAECPELGTVSQGKTFEEALTNLREATDLFVEEFGPPTVMPSRPLVPTFESAFQMNA